MSPGLSENLLWSPSGTSGSCEHPDLQNRVSNLEENSGDQEEIVFKNYCITDTLRWFKE